MTLPNFDMLDYHRKKFFNDKITSNRMLEAILGKAVEDVDTEYDRLCNNYNNMIFALYTPYKVDCALNCNYNCTCIAQSLVRRYRHHRALLKLETPIYKSSIYKYNYYPKKGKVPLVLRRIYKHIEFTNDGIDQNI